MGKPQVARQMTYRPSDKVDGKSARLDLNYLPLFVFNSRVGAKKYGNEQEDQKSS